MKFLVTPCKLHDTPATIIPLKDLELLRDQHGENQFSFEQKNQISNVGT
jgi:hypothetical protein